MVLPICAFIVSQYEGEDWDISQWWGGALAGQTGAKGPQGTNVLFGDLSWEGMQRTPSFSHL